MRTSKVSPGRLWCGTLWYGWLGRVAFGIGMARQVRFGAVGSVAVRQDLAGKERRGLVAFGLVGYVTFWRGRLGQVCIG